jgi:pimeloyl-ACP methyl ester carboxylesterase
MNRVRPLHFVSNGRTLAGRIYAPAAPSEGRPGVLFIHGLHSSQMGYWERAAALSDELGAVCLTFDLAGHGDSDGTKSALSLRDHVTDVIAAYDCLAADSEVDVGRIGAAGASYGGYLAALLTARRPVARLAMRAPMVYADSELDVPLARRETPPGVPAESAALEAVGRFSGSVLIVESGEDKDVPAAMIQAYRDAHPGAEHVVIPDAGHELNRPEWRAAFLAALTEFFREL